MEVSLSMDDAVDTDELFMIRELELVEPFQSKPFVQGPLDIQRNFREHVETVTQFCQQTRRSVARRTPKCIPKSVAP